MNFKSSGGGERRNKIKIMRIVWAILVLSLLMANNCASVPKGGVPYGEERMENTGPYRCRDWQYMAHFQPEILTLLA